MNSWASLPGGAADDDHLANTYRAQYLLSLREYLA
jgi:hypothetical protein